MADKAKRPKKKRASFEDAFAMALRATFAQEVIDAPEPEALAAESAATVAESVVKEAIPDSSQDLAQTICANEITIQNEQTTRTEETSAQNELTNCTFEIDISSEQSISTNDKDTQSEHAICTDEINKLNAQTIHSGETNTQNEQTTCTDEISTQSKPTRSTDESNTQHEHTSKPLPASASQASIHAESLLKIHLRKSLIESKAEHALVSYLQTNGNHVSSYALISEATGIPVGTLRRCFKKFIEYELITTTKYCGRGKMQGIVITILNLQAALDNIQITHRSSAKQIASYTEGSQPIGRGQAVPIVHWLQNLTDDDIATLWPALSSIQFGAKQIGQSLEILQAQGKTFDKQFGEDFKQGLDHADFALGNKGGIKDRHGRVVPKPCDYIYSSLAKDGYYPAPENYVSPQAQRAADEATRLAKEHTLKTSNENKSADIERT